jgi:hypothetical protein
MSMKKFFSVPSDHHVAMDEVHRRIAPPTNSPSLVWHLALWPDPEIRHESEYEAQIDLKRSWIDRVNIHLEEIERIISGGGAENRLKFSTSHNDYEKPRKSLYLRVQGEGFIWRIKSESHYEFVTLTISLSLVDHDDLIDEQDFFEWPSALTDYSPDVLNQAIDTLANANHDTGEKEEMSVATKLVHDDFWIRFMDAVCSGVERRHKTEEYPRFPGRLVADFRELIISVPSEVCRPFGDADDEKKRAERADHVVKNYKQLIDLVQADTDRREFVVCSMLDWQVIYATTLGARNGLESGEASVDLDDTNPVRATLFIVDPIGSHQVGRLVERINALGVARIVALIRFEAMRHVGSRVQALGIKLDNIMEGARGEVAEISEEQVKLEGILEIQSEINKLKHPIVQREDYEITDGVAYRISRSAYYTNIIETRLPDLRIERIEGFQPYDEFLRRRLFPSLRFIQDVGERIKGLHQRIDSAILSIESSATRKNMEILAGI